MVRVSRLYFLAALLLAAACTVGGAGGGGGGPRADGGGDASGPATDGGSVASGVDGGVSSGPDPDTCGVAIATTGSLDLDIPTVHLTGTITLNGGALPSATNAPVLDLRRADALEGGLVIDLGRVQQAGGHYDVRVLPGSYDLRYRYLACSVAAYPCQQEVLLRSLSVGSDGALDIDLDPVALIGRITLDGNALPSAAYTRGSALLRGSDGSTGQLAALDTAAASSTGYAARVFRGTYDLLYDNSATFGTCTGEPYPCQRSALWRASVSVSAAGALDLDLVTARITGRLTLDGAAPPAGGNAVYVAVRGADGSLGTLARFTSGGSYAARVLPGRYDLLYDDTETESGCSGAPYPCQREVVFRSAVAMNAAGALDLDVRTLHLTGRLTLDGAALPAAQYARGRIRLQGTDASTGVLADLDALSGGTYDAHVIAGTYDLLYDNPDAFAGCTGAPYPCQRDTPFRPALALSAAGALDVDLPTVRVTGTVTLAGAALPSASYTPGQLQLRGAGASLGLVADLTRGATYDARLIAGTYDLLYDNADAWGSCTGNPYPCQRSVRLRGGTSFSTSAALDVDLPVVRLSGRVTLDGATLPTASYGRGEIRLQGADGSLGRLLQLDVAPNGYDARVFPQNYDLYYRDDDTRCTGSPYPCHARVLRGCDAATR